jgi:Amiloride-sensitive sodium channel
MVALVHGNTQAPPIELAAMLLAPGRHHKLSYTKRVSTFLPSPYTECTDEVNLGLQVMYDEYSGTNYSYSRYDCIFACMQAYM